MRFPKSDQAHTKVRYCLFHADDKEARRAAELLDALRAARNLADYDLQDSYFAAQTAARSALVLAQGVCGLLAQCDAPERKPNIEARVRDYARTVLGLSVL